DPGSGAAGRARFRADAERDQADRLLRRGLGDRGCRNRSRPGLCGLGARRPPGPAGPENAVYALGVNALGSPPGRRVAPRFLQAKPRSLDDVAEYVGPSTLPPADVCEVGWVNGLGLATPATAHPRSFDESLAAAAEIGYPLFMKPSDNVVFKRIHKRQAFVCETRAELEHAYRVTADYEPMVQEFIPGGDEYLWS